MANRIIGTPGNDSLDGTGGDDLISLLAGNDTSDGLAGSDKIYGGDGNDSLRDTTTLPVLLTAPVTDNALYGGNGDDALGLSVSTTDSPAPQAAHVVGRLEGGSGNDAINARVDMSNGFVVNGDSSLKLFGNSGNDVLDAYVVASHGCCPVAQTLLDGGSGDDVLTAFSRAVPSASSKPGGDNTITLEGGVGDDQIRATAEQGFPKITVHGGGGNDDIYVQASMFNLYAASATCEVHGGSGNDVIRAKAETSVTGIGGNPSVNILHGDAGNDIIIGQANVLDPSATMLQSRNELYGGSGRDLLIAIGGKENILDGGNGSDVLTGFVSRDHFVLRDGDGFDAVTNFQKGVDVFNLDGLTFGDLTLQVSQAAGGTIIRDGDESLALVWGVYDLGESDFTSDILIA